MYYHLRIYDNYHPMDESEAYDQGSFDTYTQAVAEAKKIIYEYMVYNWSRGMTLDDLIRQYSFYGADPVILPAGKGILPGFSARDYAGAIAEEICTKLEAQQAP